MKKILLFILDRAKERSTWLGVISLLTALGILLSQEQTDAVVAAGMSLAGLVAALSKDDEP